jgi:hypothetical protein
VLRAACCVLRAACCVLRASCFVLRASCFVLNQFSAIFRIVKCRRDVLAQNLWNFTSAPGSLIDIG